MGRRGVRVRRGGGHAVTVTYLARIQHWQVEYVCVLGALHTCSAWMGV